MEGYGNGLYGPGDPVTREQLAAILYRYERARNGIADTETTRLDFTDASSVSGWAYASLCWCSQNKILYGHEDGTLRPKGNTTRAEAASMLMRYFTRGNK